MQSLYDFDANDKKQQKPPSPAAPFPAAPSTGQHGAEKPKPEAKPLSQPGPAPAAKPAAPPVRSAAGPGTNAYGEPKGGGSRLLGVVNLLLLLVVIAFQVRIIFWQQGINANLKELEDEVNKEKVERVELGNKLLEQIEKVETPGPAGSSVQDQARVYATTAKITLRSQASSKGKKLASLNKGTYVSAVDEQGDWQKVQYGKRSGWVNKKYLAAVGQVKVSDKILTLRAKAMSKAAAVTKLKKGELATVLDYSGGWFQLEANGKKGWAGKRSVTVVK